MTTRMIDEVLTNWTTEAGPYIWIKYFCRETANEVNITISNVTVNKNTQKLQTSTETLLSTTTPKIVSRAQPPKKQTTKDKNSATSSKKKVSHLNQIQVCSP